MKSSKAGRALAKCAGVSDLNLLHPWNVVFKLSANEEASWRAKQQSSLVSALMGRVPVTCTSECLV